MQTVIGIDVGGTTTKIVGFNKKEDGITLIEPQFVRATDPVTSAYGAFGKFTLQNGIELDKIDCVMMTGAGSASIDKPIYSVKCNAVSEFSCIGRGGGYQHGYRYGSCICQAQRKRDRDKVSRRYRRGWRYTCRTYQKDSRS